MSSKYSFYWPRMLNNITETLSWIFFYPYRGNYDFQKHRGGSPIHFFLFYSWLFLHWWNNSIFCDGGMITHEFKLWNCEHIRAHTIIIHTYIHTYIHIYILIIMQLQHTCIDLQVFHVGIVNISCQILIRRHISIPTRIQCMYMIVWC